MLKILIPISKKNCFKLIYNIGFQLRVFKMKTLELKKNTSM